MEPGLPRVGERILTPTGEWQVKDVMLLGRSPLHFAVRATHTDPAGASYTVVLSAAEYRALRQRAPAPPRRR